MWPMSALLFWYFGKYYVVYVTFTAVLSHRVESCVVFYTVLITT